MTFYELYKETGKELCVVVTNLNLLTSEYCHPKTTPNMHIREALLMSMAIPGLFQARVYGYHGIRDTYVDGGVLCNYPIHCYDGRYLSLEKDDAFLLQLQSLETLRQTLAIKNRFDNSKNTGKTVGFLVYDDTEVEVMRYSLENRVGANLPEKPHRDTELYKYKQEATKEKSQKKGNLPDIEKAVMNFMEVLHKHNQSDQEVIDKNELRNALEDTKTFTPEMRELLFGKNTDVDTVFSKLDKDGSGQIAIWELLQFMEERGICIQARIHGYGRTKVKNLMQFVSPLQNSLTTNVKFMHVSQETDVHRSVGINTGHVGTTDFVLEKEDRCFLVQRGYSATRTFLQYFVHKYPQFVKMKDGSSVGNNQTTTTEPGPLETVEEANAEDIQLLPTT